MSVLALIRPDSWNFPLLLHVLGAMALVGALVTALAVQVVGWRGRGQAEAAAFARLAFRTLLIGAVPAWVLMRLGGQWIGSREGLADIDNPPAWIDIGFTTADLGGIVLVVSLVVAWFGARRLSRSGGGSALARGATVLTVVLVLAYLVAVWAMTAKPV